MRRRSQSQEAGALELFEEAVGALRHGPRTALLAYYLGSLPFVFGLLLFWTDMSRSSFAPDRAVQASLGIALLFVWMKVWQGVFCSLVRAHLQGGSEPWTRRRVWRLASTQATLQPTGLFCLPLALLLTFPIGWVYAFYQNVTVLAGENSPGSGATLRRALRQAQFWPGQNHVCLAWTALFGVLLVLNLGITVIQLPWLLKTLFGIETVFTLSLWSFFNTTYLAILLGLAYLCLDPLLKTVYTLRCFYGDSIESGEDLRVELQRAGQMKPASGWTAVALALLWFSLAAPSQANGSGEPPPPPGHARASSSAEALDQALDSVLARPEYRWRFPRQHAPRQPGEGLFARFIEGLAQTVKEGFQSLLDTLERAAEWLIHKLFPQEAGAAPGGGRGWAESLRWLLIVLAGLFLAGIGLLLWRAWKQRQKGASLEAEPVQARPDLRDENVRAGDLPQEEWLRLAAELLEQGQLRLALRAFYLAGLSHLAAREFIQLARFKSNREYEAELRRRARDNLDLSECFGGVVGVFERVWYGRADVTPELLRHFQSDVERITAC